MHGDARVATMNWKTIMPQLNQRNTCHSPLIRPEASLLLPRASQISTPSFKQTLTSTPSCQIGDSPGCVPTAMPSRLRSGSTRWRWCTGPRSMQEAAAVLARICINLVNKDQITRRRGCSYTPSQIRAHQALLPLMWRMRQLDLTPSFTRAMSGGGVLPKGGS